ncbi:MAG: PTS system mannose/fructose/sorbose family transporter subunit IID [Candidatus Zixiibacteriota bacterium]
MEKIWQGDLFRLYLRSFFVQTGWNYERMIAFGFAWILSPLAKKLYPAEEERKGFLRRHLLTFNANPYLATYAVGAVAKLEEMGTLEEEICKFKNSMRGPLGALGDSLIWMNLRPALLILGIILASTFGGLGALVFWSLYNIHQLYVRARGLFKGYNLGLKVVSDLRSAYYPQMIKWGGRMGAVFLGIFFALRVNERIAEKVEDLIIFILMVPLSIFGFRKNINPNYILGATILSSLLVKWIIVFF